MMSTAAGTHTKPKGSLPAMIEENVAPVGMHPGRHPQTQRDARTRRDSPRHQGIPDHESRLPQRRRGRAASASTAIPRRRHRPWPRRGRQRLAADRALLHRHPAL